MTRHSLRLQAAIATAILLGIIVLAGQSNSAARPTNSAPPEETAESRRLATVAGAGMIGSHVFTYLTELSDNIGARVTGSPEAARAVEWGLATMRAMGLENVHSEKFQIWRGWTRGIAEAELLSPARRRLMVDAMGWVGSTPTGGITADVLDVDLNNLDAEMSANSATSTLSHSWSDRSRNNSS